MLSQSNLYKHNIYGDIQLKKRTFHVSVHQVPACSTPVVVRLTALTSSSCQPASQQNNRQLCNSCWQKSACPGIQEHSLFSTVCSVTSQLYSTHYAQHATLLSSNRIANTFRWKKMLSVEPRRKLHLWPDTYLIIEWEVGSRHGILYNGYCIHCQTQRTLITVYIARYWTLRLHSGSCEQLQTLNTIVAHMHIYRHWTL